MSESPLITSLEKLDLVRADFPLLATQVHGQQIAYLDNAATSQKPQVVIDRISTYYQHENANVHRGVHTLSQIATDTYEDSRKPVGATGQRRCAASDTR